MVWLSVGQYFEFLFYFVFYEHNPGKEEMKRGSGKVSVDNVSVLPQELRWSKMVRQNYELMP